jgi:hypothetical protein
MAKLRTQPPLLLEGLEYMDLEAQVLPQVSIDEYKAKVDSDDEVITLAFITKGVQQAEDLAEWFDRGYDWILDSEPSEGELSPGRYVVFVEMPRRSTAPDRIIELLDDLETLTDLSLVDWTLKIDDEDYEADPAAIKKHITLSPHDYREAHEETLNEWRVRSGIEPQPLYDSAAQDEAIKHFKSLAGL